MPPKTPGKLNQPPPQKEFDSLPLANWCVCKSGIFYRLHSFDRNTGKPWPPVFFSTAGRTRFDPAAGPGTFYVGETLAGVMLEVFDDSWGPVNSLSRSLTKTQLTEWAVTLVAVPPVVLFEAQSNLSKMGTDMQLLSGDHAISREWALCLTRHPLKIDGIYYSSRHDSRRFNLAIFKQRAWQREQFDAALTGQAAMHRGRVIDSAAPIMYGPSVLLRDHLELNSALAELEVAILP
jgi:hypothetical protein